MSLRRCLSWLLLVCVCLLVPFSNLLTVYAQENNSYFLGEEVPLIDPNIAFFGDSMDTGYVVGTFTRDINGQLIYIGSGELDLSRNDLVWNADGSLDITYNIVLPSALAKNALYDMSFYFISLYGNIVFQRLEAYTSSWKSLDEDYTGSFDYMYQPDDEYYIFTGNISDFSADGGACKNLYVVCKYYPNESDTVLQTYYENISISEVSSGGLLNSIIQLIRNIVTGITDLPKNIANSIKGFFDNVVNAVTSIGNLIKNALVDLGNFLIDGIKSLFVPTQEDIQEYTDKWSELLADRFGCLYEVVDMVSEYVESFKSYNEKGTINIPVVSLDFGGVPFEFGGWNVDIVPDGFGFLFDSLKIAIDMVCTIAFVNGLKRRYDILMERG